MKRPAFRRFCQPWPCRRGLVRPPSAPAVSRPCRAANLSVTAPGAAEASPMPSRVASAPTSTARLNKRVASTESGSGQTFSVEKARPGRPAYRPTEARWRGDADGYPDSWLLVSPGGMAINSSI